MLWFSTQNPKQSLEDHSWKHCQNSYCYIEVTHIVKHSVSKHSLLKHLSSKHSLTHRVLHWVLAHVAPQIASATSGWTTSCPEDRASTRWASWIRLDRSWSGREAPTRPSPPSSARPPPKWREFKWPWPRGENGESQCEVSSHRVLAPNKTCRSKVFEALYGDGG